MARIRKEPNRYWSKEDKYKIVLKVIDDVRSTVDVAKEYDISKATGFSKDEIEKIKE